MIRTLAILIFAAVQASAAIAFSVGDSAMLAANDPRKFSGLVAYWRGSYLGGLSEGARVPTWPDCSGSANDATNGTSSTQPFKATDYLGNIACRFDAVTNTFLNIPSSLSVTSKACSVYIRVRGMGVNDATSGPGYIDLGNGSQAFWYMANASGWRMTLLDGGGNPNMPINKFVSTESYSVLGRIASSSSTYFWNADTFYSASATTSNLLSGGRIGQRATGGFELKGDITDICVYNRALSTNEDVAVRKALAPQPFYWNLIFDGDSLTKGYTIANPTHPIITNTYPWKACRQLSSVKGGNIGVTGAKLTAMPVVSLASVNTNDYGKNVVIIWGGTNDIYVDGVDNATVLTRLQSYVSARKAEGWKVIILSMIVRSQFDPTMEGYRVAFNSSISSDHSFADGFADVAADARLQNYSDTTYFESDGVHLTPTGYGVVADIVVPVINSM